MATVTREFKENFDFWIARKQASGEFSKEEAEELRAMIRTDLTHGPDQLRKGLTVINAAGVEVPAMIDDHEARYKLWADFFKAEANEMRSESVVGINQRTKAAA